jgi:hypothetical protein
MSIPRATPILIALLLLSGLPGAARAQRWTAVDVGTGHSCALDAAGRAWCWGINHDGQLGAPTPRTCGASHHGERSRCWASESARPVPVSGGMPFRALSAGGNVSCALDADGRAWCWGKGVGAAAEGCASGGVCSFRPVPFAPQTAFAALRVGEDAVCGVTTGGAGHCWRPVRGGRGQWAMTAVAPGERLAWVDQYADWMDSDDQIICAVAADGRGLCQGMNDYAQLGAGDTVTYAQAVHVASQARFVRVHPWSGSTCGLTAEGGVACWGVARPRPSWPDGTPPEPYMFACGYSGWCSGPRTLSPEMRFTALAIVRDRFCALDASGRVHCWGRDDVPVRVAEGVRFTTLEGAETHACGLTREGAVWCWKQDSGARPGPPVRAPDPPR